MCGTTTKSFTSNKYVREFDSKVEAIERKVIPSIRRFYNKEYEKGISNFINSGNVQAPTLFQNNDIVDKYKEMYVNIGLHIANWYFRSFEKYHSKADPKPYKSKWQNAFETYGALIARYNAPLVSGTAKKTLIALTDRLMKDPEFQALGNRQQARILRSKFKQYSDYQARRLVRTESTRAANYAIEQSSTTMFAPDQLSKEWVTVGDAKVRNWHQAVNGQRVRFDEPFNVMGESIMRPGEGTAKNTINCRCRMITIPDEGAVPITEITDIGVGIGQSRIPSFSLETITNQVIEATVVNEVVEELTQKQKMTPDNWKQVVGKAKINDDYLELLDNKLNVKTVKGGGSYQQGLTIVIDIKRFNDKTIGQVLAHEVGHAIHEQRAWITRKLGGFSQTHKLIQELFVKHKSFFGSNLRGRKRIDFQKKYKQKFYSSLSRSLDDWNSSKKYRTDLRKKFPNLTDKEFEEYWVSTVDYIGALTKNQVGYGHSTGYYSNQQWQKFEMFAHIMENKYHGNPVFKKIFPGLYKEGIDMLDKLIKEYKSGKP